MVNRMATVTANKIFVGGKWTDAAEGGTMEVINPATGETIAEVPACTAADVDAAVEAAGAALPEWLDSTPAERAELLLNLADVVWPLEGTLDVVFCRNVLMYLEAGHRYAVLERIASLLEPGGLLLLDPSEHLGGAAPLFVSRGNGAYSRQTAARAPSRPHRSAGR